MLTPIIGVMDWKYAQEHINWGTLVVFAAGISLGKFLLDTGAATWLSEATFGAIGLASMPIIATIALVSLFNILIHLGFYSRRCIQAPPRSNSGAAWRLQMRRWTDREGEEIPDG